MTMAMARIRLVVKTYAPIHFETEKERIEALARLGEEVAADFQKALEEHSPPKFLYFFEVADRRDNTDGEVI